MMPPRSFTETTVASHSFKYEFVRKNFFRQHQRYSIQEGTGRFFSLRKAGLNNFGLILGAEIAKDRHNCVARPHFLGHSDRAGDVDAARSAQTKTFFLKEVEHDGQCFFVRNLVGVIKRGTIEIPVIRPWPIPSEIELPSDFSSPVLM